MRKRNTSFYLLIGLALLLRLLFIGRYPDSWDAVDFALGIERYDLFQMQPHFPGYPIYILFAKWMNILVNQPILSLSIVSAIASLFTVLLIFLTVRNLFNEKISFYVTLLTIVNPALWLIGDQPMSDSMGIMMVWLVLWIISKSIGKEGSSTHLKTGIIVSFLFALSMGVRISYFPFGFLLFIPLVLSIENVYDVRRLFKHSLYMGLSFLLGIMTWLLPIAYTEGGIVQYIQLGMAFTSGHFNDWGGTIFSEETSIFVRIIQYFVLILTSLGGHVFAETQASFINWFVNIWLSIGIIYVIYHRRNLLIRLKGNKNWKLISLFALSTIPYTIWVLVGQNIDKPRHVAILLPFLFIIFALIGQSIGKGLKVWMVGLSILTLAHSIPMLVTYVMQPPPMVKLANDINRNYQQENTSIITWEEERVIDYLYPGYHTIRLRKMKDFEKMILLYGEDRTILVTNAVLDGFGDKKKEYAPFLEPVFKVEANSFLYPTYNHIVLYRANKTFYHWVQTK